MFNSLPSSVLAQLTAPSLSPSLSPSPVLRRQPTRPHRDRHYVTCRAGSAFPLYGTAEEDEVFFVAQELAGDGLEDMPDLRLKQ